MDMIVMQEKTKDRTFISVRYTEEQLTEYFFDIGNGNYQIEIYSGFGFTASHICDIPYSANLMSNLVNRIYNMYQDGSYKKFYMENTPGFVLYDVVSCLGKENACNIVNVEMPSNNVVLVMYGDTYTKLLEADYGYVITNRYGKIAIPKDDPLYLPTAKTYSALVYLHELKETLYGMVYKE